MCGCAVTPRNVDLRIRRDAEVRRGAEPKRKEQEASASCMLPAEMSTGLGGSLCFQGPVASC